MDEPAWSQLLATITVEGTLLPVGTVLMDAYEEQTGFRLPGSYRCYCRVFGPGTLAEWYAIATPGYAGRFADRFELVAKNKSFREWTDWEEYIPNSEQFRRAVIFAGDETGAVYFGIQRSHPSQRRTSPRSTFCGGITRSSGCALYSPNSSGFASTKPGRLSMVTSPRRWSFGLRGRVEQHSRAGVAVPQRDLS
jgi:hypothetical protein